jgi:sugar lactone lactonase YvrE
MGLAADAAGNVYVADSQSNRIRKLTWDSVADTYTASTIAGSGGYGNADGAALSATFSNPVDVAVDAAGNVFVADQYNNIVRKVTYSGGVYTTVSTIPAPLSSTISGIDVDQWGHLYVSDLWGMRVLKLTYNPDTGTYTPGVFAGSGTWGSADGPGASATFGAPAFLAVDLGGNVHVADSYNHIIRKIAPDGYVTREGGLADWFGYGTADGGRDASRFKFPTGIAVSTDGTLYVGDRDNHLIRKIK